MSDQVGSDMAAGHAAEGGQLSSVSATEAAVVEEEARAAQQHHGRPVSWVAVGTMMAAFLGGGIGLITGPTWWLFWVGVAMCAAGGLLALATRIFDDWY
jgi:uncharacterized membrane protein